VDLVAAVGADQHEVSQLRARQKILQQIQGGRIQPLQVVEEQGQRMLASCEHADETTESEVEAALSQVCRNLGKGRLLADQEPQFRNQVHDQLAILLQRGTQVLAPPAERCLALRQQRPDQTLKSLCQRRVGNVACVLIELAGSKQAARRHQY